MKASKSLSIMFLFDPRKSHKIVILKKKCIEGSLAWDPDLIYSRLCLFNHQESTAYKIRFLKIFLLAILCYIFTLIYILC